MWLIEKSQKDKSHAVLLSSGLKAHIVDWYKGRGNEADHERAVFTVHQARFKGEWFLCDCRMEEGTEPPIIAPAYIAVAECFYLRRLTGDKRPQHAETCPFWREQKAVKPKVKKPDIKAQKSLALEYFEILRPVKMQLATEAPPQDEDRNPSASIPRLARLLWMLMYAAGLNVIRSNVDRTQLLGIDNAYRRLLIATQGFKIAPERPLSANFVPGLDEPEKQLPAIIRGLSEDSKDWPAGHQPQTFAVVFAEQISGEKIHLRNGQTIEVATRVVRPSAYKQSIPGPYLVMILIGQLTERTGAMPVRAYAQPIVSETHIMAIDSDLERKTSLQLIDMQIACEKEAQLLHIEKPIFDYETSRGLCRPDFVLEYHDRAKDLRRKLIIETMGYTNDEYLAAKATTIPRMETIAPVLKVEPGDVAGGLLQSMLTRSLLA